METAENKYFVVLNIENNLLWLVVTLRLDKKCVCGVHLVHLLFTYLFLSAFLLGVEAFLLVSCVEGDVFSILALVSYVPTGIYVSSLSRKRNFMKKSREVFALIIFTLS